MTQYRFVKLRETANGLAAIKALRSMITIQNNNQAHMVLGLSEARAHIIDGVPMDAELFKHGPFHDVESDTRWVAEINTAMAQFGYRLVEDRPTNFIPFRTNEELVLEIKKQFDLGMESLDAPYPSKEDKPLIDLLFKIYEAGYKTGYNRRADEENIPNY
jgi:hypothetical protein